MSFFVEVMSKVNEKISNLFGGNEVNHIMDLGNSRYPSDDHGWSMRRSIK